ncbi:uncharacterized protein BDZ99DRAFT_399578 [Mytilinidion resinicola]|uniref:Transcription factor domain-containing protein n=1 Tax=Mytilinidion resinicola TaxID=574789 RepID=A0A6A6Y4Z1_9PEZI|nr:uncharacterized protein BDZ99DRAFT_399578 [Mytilinidion resinicola]KAF2803588.1 hypothetical protein BDZ99DRAFT_399578 [Mytilinidion resinicola]
MPRIEDVYYPDNGRQLSPLSLDLPLSIPDLFSPGNSRSLVRRSMSKPLAQSSADILTRMFGSFTSMMARKETFPPFIHPRCFSNIPGKEHEIPETLVNCMSLSRMFAERTPGTSKLLWRTIRMEHERLWFQHDSFDNWELLAAVQALVIYTLMRMVDGETEHNDFDVPLLISVNSICQRLADRIGGGEFKNIMISEQQAWQDWVFYESRRRFVVIARMLNMLVEMGQAVTCSSLPGFALVPLPSKKVLWEAPNEEVWQKEFESTLRAREIFGVTTEGRLVRLMQDMSGITATNAEWEDWYAGSDGFGSLVMLAASLLG